MPNNSFLVYYHTDIELSDPSSITQKEVAPHILLGRVHKQHRLLLEFLQGSVDEFCLRVAHEVVATAKDNQLGVIKTYMDSVAHFIDSTRPHTVSLWTQFGAISEWKDARTVQNKMSLVIQNLDEIHHHAESGDLSDAMSINLLSFQ